MLVLLASVFGIRPALATNYSCVWAATTGNAWTTPANWTSCNSTDPDNGSGNTFDATIGDGGTSVLSSASITVGNISISGSLDLQNSAALTTTSGVTVNGPSGQLYLDTGGTGGSQMTVGGNLTNTANDYSGIEVGNSGMSKASSLTVDGSFTNTGGYLALAGGSGVAATSTMTVNGTNA
ncbi:MAG: hypothetical protein ACRETB_10955, partial [Steroidobacteraceae bacterium]